MSFAGNFPTPGKFFFDGWSVAGLGSTPNIVIEVDAQLLSGDPANMTYGLIFNYRDNRTFHFFEIQPSGFWDLCEATGGYFNDLIGFRPSPDIRSNTGLNRLRVEITPEQVRLAVNGIHLTTYDLVSTGGDVGLLVTNWLTSSPAEVSFDNLTVTQNED